MKLMKLVMIVAGILGCPFLTDSGVAQEPQSNSGIDQKADAQTNDVSGLSIQWETISPSGSNVKLKMPGKPRLVERTFTPVEGQPSIKVRLYLLSINQGRAAFIFSYHDLNRVPVTKKEIDATLSGAIKGSIANVAGKELAQSPIPNSKFPGRSFVYLFAQNQKIHQVAARVVLVGNRQYQVSVIMVRDTFDVDTATTFLDSLEILDAAHDFPPRPPKPLERPDPEIETDPK